MAVTRVYTASGWVDVDGGGLQPSLADAKGDLFVASAPDVVSRLPVGTTAGHVLTVDTASSVGISWQAPSGAPSNMLTTNTDQVVTGIKTFDPGDLLMRNAAGTLTAEPYSDVNAPGTLERTLQAAPAVGVNPIAGESFEWSTDGKSLDMRAPDGTTTRIGPSAGSSSTAYKKTSNQALTSTGVTPITDLVFPIGVNQFLEFELFLAITSAAATTGWLFGFTGPASPTSFFAVHEYQSSASAWTTATIQAIGNFALVTAAYAASPSAIGVRIKGVIQNGANAGNVQLVGATEVNGSAVTVRGGSTMKVV